MRITQFLENNFRNKYEYKVSKLSDENLDKQQKKIIKKLCKSFADDLDFYEDLTRGGKLK